MAMALFGFKDPNEIIASCPPGNPLGCGGMWDWAALSGVALSVSGVLLAFLYVWSVLFRNSQMEASVRQELYELVFTAFIVVLLFGVVGSMHSMQLRYFLPSNMIPADVSPEMNVYQATALYYVTVGEDMEGWLNLNYVFNMYIDQMASITPYARPLGVGLVASPMAGFASPIKQLLYNMSVAISVAFIINYAQLFVYLFALEAFLRYYLPVGILLRSFTPTRRLGGTIIGVAATFLFVFPAMTTITFAMLYSSDGPLLSFRSLFAAYLPDFVDKFGNFAGDNFTGGGFVDLVSGVFGGIGSLLENVIGTVFLTVLIFPISMISLGFVVGFILPAFNITIFIQAAKGLSKALGEEVDISALTRLI